MAEDPHFAAKTVRGLFRPVLIAQALAGIGVLAALYLISLENFLLFHGIIELAGIAVACAIFIIIWNIRKTVPDAFYLIIGISFLFIGSMDLIHTLAYKGMGVFSGTDSDLPTQIWIAARYFQSITFLIATLFIGRTITRDRKYDTAIVVSACTAACALLFLSLFVWHNFPPCFVEGSGLTLFKIASEYVISLILIATILILYRKREHFEPDVFQYLVAAQAFLILGELAFTSYVSVYGSMTMLGHLFRLVSVYLFYRAFVVVSLNQPYDHLQEAYEKLTASEEEIRANYEELARTQNALSDSERKYRNLYRYAQVALFETSFKDATVIACNKRYADLAGFNSVAEAIGSDILHLYVNPEDRAEVGRILRKQGYIENQIIRLRNRSTKKEFWAQFSARFDYEREVAEGTLIDITLLKETENALRKNEKKFRETVMLLDEGYYRCTLEGIVLEHNRAFNRILGIEPDRDMKGAALPDFWQEPGDRVNYLRELEENGFVRNFTINAKTLSGSPITVLASAHRVKDDSGAIGEIEGIVTDITELRHAEQALRDEQEFSRLVLDGSPAFYVAIGHDGKTIMMNRALLNALEYTADEVKGMDYLTTFVPIEDRESLSRVFAETISGNITVNMNRIVSKSGKVFTVEWRGNPVRQGRGKDAFFVGVGIDITGRRLAEEALRESEARLRSFIETTQDAITIIDEEGQVIEWNAGSERLSGISRADVLGRFIWDVNFQLVPPERRTDAQYAGLKESMKNALATGIPAFREPRVFEAVRLDGTRFFSRHTIFPIKTARGYRFGSVVQDITSEKLAEEALRETTKKLIEAQELAHLGFWSWDVKTGDVEWSDEVFRIFGLDPGTFKPTIDSVLARSPWPEDHERDKELIQRAIDSHEPGSYEQRFLRPDNSTGYYYSTFQGQYDNSGNLVSIIGTILDITERRRADEALRESEVRFRTLVSQMPVGIVMTRRTDKSEDVIYLNDTFTEITGYTIKEIPSFAKWALLAYPDPEYRRIIAAMVPDTFLEAAKNLTSNPRVTRVTCNDGTVKDIEFRYTSLKSFGFWTMTDITERLRADEQREILIRELEQKNAELERFTYTVSHDLKSPLITIRGFASLLENDSQTGNPAVVKRDIERINNAAETMQTLLNDILELSRLGRVINPPTKVSLETIAREAVDLLSGPITERGVQVDIASGLPEVRVDHVRVREVLVNLIENAIKFTGSRPDPKIWIGVETGGPEPVFFVRDNGIGIDPRYLNRIFNLFEKLEPQIPGTGIGLPIVKRIIEMHGGRIWAESEGTGKGTTIRFTLPERDDPPGTG